MLFGGDIERLEWAKFRERGRQGGRGGCKRFRGSRARRCEKAASLQECASVGAVERSGRDARHELQERSADTRRGLTEKHTELVVRAQSAAREIRGADEKSIAARTFREERLRVKESGVLERDADGHALAVRGLEREQRFEDGAGVEAATIDGKHDASAPPALQYCADRRLDDLDARHRCECRYQNKERCVRERRQHLAGVSFAGGRY